MTTLTASTANRQSAVRAAWYAAHSHRRGLHRSNANKLRTAFLDAYIRMFDLGVSDQTAVRIFNAATVEMWRYRPAEPAQSLRDGRTFADHSGEACITARVLPRPVDSDTLRETCAEYGHVYRGPGRSYQHGPYLSRTPTAVTVWCRGGLDI